MSGPARESGQVNAWLGLLAVLTCVTLVLTALRPGLAVSLVIFSCPAIAGQEAVVMAAGAAAEVVPAAASVAVGGRSVPLRACTAVGGLAQLQVSRIASTSFRVIRPVLFEVLRTS